VTSKTTLLLFRAATQLKIVYLINLEIG